MYSIQGLENVFDVMAYTISALRDSGFSESDIESYISDAFKDGNNLGVITVSKEWLNECNKMHSSELRDSELEDYYTSFWDTSDEDSYEEDEEDSYDYLMRSQKKEAWEYDNAIDDLEPDEEEVYEGFSSCKKYTVDYSSLDDFDII